MAHNEPSEVSTIILSVNHDSCLYIVALDHCQENAVSVLKVSVIDPFNRDILPGQFPGASVTGRSAPSVDAAASSSTGGPPDMRSATGCFEGNNTSFLRLGAETVIIQVVSKRALQL